MRRLRKTDYLPFGKLRCVARYLKSRFKLRYPLKIIKEKLRQNVLGYCELRSKKGRKFFVIGLDKRLGETTRILVFTHEFAHALCWRLAEALDDEEHSVLWAATYYKVYNSLLEDDDNSG